MVYVRRSCSTSLNPYTGLKLKDLKVFLPRISPSKVYVTSFKTLTNKRLNDNSVW